MEVRSISFAGVLAIVALLLFPWDGSAVLSAAHQLSSPQQAQGVKKQVSYNGISFAYDPSLARGVTAHTLPELKGDANSADWEIHPEEVTFEFRDFAFATTQIAPATIYVFPVKSSYRILNPQDPHSQDLWLHEVSTLRALVTQRPKLTEPATLEGSNLPFLPPVNAATILVGKQDYLSFGSGTGLRYLLQLTQQPIPPSHDDTAYSFQGITNDGKYYLAATFPIFLATPPNLPFPQTNQRDADDYSHRLRAIMDSAPSSDFKPNLDKLDDIIRSLTIDESALTLPSAPASAVPVGMPRTGHVAGETGILGAVMFALASALIGYGLRIRVSRRRVATMLIVRRR